MLIVIVLSSCTAASARQDDGQSSRRAPSLDSESVHIPIKESKQSLFSTLTKERLHTTGQVASPKKKQTNRKAKHSRFPFKKVATDKQPTSSHGQLKPQPLAQLPPQTPSKTYSDTTPQAPIQPLSPVLLNAVLDKTLSDQQQLSSNLQNQLETKPTAPTRRSVLLRPNKSDQLDTPEQGARLNLPVAQTNPAPETLSLEPEPKPETSVSVLRKPSDILFNKQQELQFVKTKSGIRSKSNPPATSENIFESRLNSLTRKQADNKDKVAKQLRAHLKKTSTGSKRMEAFANPPVTPAGLHSDSPSTVATSTPDEIELEVPDESFESEFWPIDPEPNTPTPTALPEVASRDDRGKKLELDTRIELPKPTTAPTTTTTPIEMTISGPPRPPVYANLNDIEGRAAASNLDIKNMRMRIEDIASEKIQEPAPGKQQSPTSVQPFASGGWRPSLSKRPSAEGKFQQISNRKMLPSGVYENFRQGVDDADGDELQDEFETDETDGLEDDEEESAEVAAQRIENQRNQYRSDLHRPISSAPASLALTYVDDDGSMVPSTSNKKTYLLDFNNFYGQPIAWSYPRTNSAGYQWYDKTAVWKSPDLCYQPLYYEDVNLERFGARRPFIQPALSAVHFFASTVRLPYAMALDPPWECQYAAGFGRPGTHYNYCRQQLPLDLKAGSLQTLLVTSLIFAIP